MLPPGLVLVMLFTISNIVIVWPHLLGFETSVWKFIRVNSKSLAPIPILLQETRVSVQRLECSFKRLECHSGVLLFQFYLEGLRREG